MKRISVSHIIGTLFLFVCCICSLLPIALGFARSLFTDTAFTNFNYFSSYKEVTVSYTHLTLPTIA